LTTDYLELPLAAIKKSYHEWHEGHEEEKELITSKISKKCVRYHALSSLRALRLKQRYLTIF